MVSIKLQEVDNILQQSRFDITLPEFLPLYFGAKILPNKEAALLETGNGPHSWQGYKSRPSPR
ncbi:MAG: hypothetical protein Q7J85_10040 [Bacillota bacterium]|nr:hypothetical protein [Bacillota bacterium]